MRILNFINYILFLIFGTMFVGSSNAKVETCLYPRDSETREVKTLDGIWNFRKSNITDPTEGIQKKWYEMDLRKSGRTIPMPVPSSYNDITEDRELRDHVGTVWYDRKFFTPLSWSDNKRVWIRFGSVHYESIVWINGRKVYTNEIGHLPFQVDITEELQFGEENRVTVLCDNVLTQTTIPQGTVQKLASDNEFSIVQTYDFDFFNYAGIHRSVMLYTTPVVYIKDVYVTSEIIDGTIGRVNYEITPSNYTEDEPIQIMIHIKDKEGEIVATTYAENNTIDNGDDSLFKGSVDINNANFWWPYLMNTDPGYLYTFEVVLQTESGEVVDIYRLKIGIRSLEWNNKQFLINGKPIYFRGFGRHEDSDIRGKGLDLALLTKDFNLLKWVGANSYRTSHYPYSEESMQFADENGIMIIDECPSVDTTNYTPTLLLKHKLSIEKLIYRDRNHPSAVMWSIANEPRTALYNADSYFGEVANYTRSLDKHRPITASIATPLNNDKAAQFLDIISFNRYNGWYSNPGRLDMITKHVVDEAIAWNSKHNKPVLMSEYGADTIAGLHLLPSYVWSEEYQRDLFARHFKAFDILRRKGFFIGEFIWNFADFKTNQTYTRVGGNKKGIFTRNRQPKEVAHYVRKRYFTLAKHLDQNKECLPEDLFSYIFENASDTDNNKDNEL